jgi:hypothetical protein
MAGTSSPKIITNPWNRAEPRHVESQVRYRTLFFVLPGVTMAIAMAGCGSEQPADRPAEVPPGQASGGTAATAHPPAKPQGSTVLRVAYKQSAETPVRIWTLTCDPVTGDHPNAKPACAALEAAAAARTDPFAPTPHGRPCSMIYGGPESSAVTGSWQNRKIDAHFSRQDGCAVKRWAALAPLLGELARPR